MEGAYDFHCPLNGPAPYRIDQGRDTSRKAGLGVLCPNLTLTTRIDPKRELTKKEERKKKSHKARFFFLSPD